MIVVEVVYFRAVMFAGGCRNTIHMDVEMCVNEPGMIVICSTCVDVLERRQ